MTKPDWKPILLLLIYRYILDFDDGFIYKGSDYVLVKEMEDSQSYP